MVRLLTPSPTNSMDLVQRAVHADLTDQVQDDVLAGDGTLDGAGQLDLDGGGHLEPGHARWPCRRPYR